MSAFKDAIKSSTRELKGYVEVLYDNPTIKSSITQIDGGFYNPLNILPECDKFQIVDGKRVTNPYATFEPNHFKSDGSVLLLNRDVINNNMGYVSEQMSDEFGQFNDTFGVRIKNPTYTTNESYPGITIYFDDVYPRRFSVVVWYYPPNYVSGGSELAYFSFGGSGVSPLNDEQILFLPFEYSSIDRIEFNSGETGLPILMSSPRSRLRIREIDYGLTKVYADGKLISMNTTEEVDPLSFELSKDELNVTLSNIDYEFDMLNPIGIATKLKEGIPIYPYVGILTAENGIEYVKMGEYFLTQWSANSDFTMTMTALNLLHKLSNTYGTFRAIPGVVSFTPTTYFDKLMLEYGITNYRVNVSCVDIINDQLLELGTILEQLQALAIFSSAMIYVDRDGVLCFEDITTNVIDQIDLGMMLNNPINKENVDLKKITFNIKTLSGFAVDPIEIHNSTRVINGTEDVIIKYPYPVLINSITIGGTGTLLNEAHGGTFSVLTISGTGSVTINIMGQTFETSVITKEIVNSTVGEEIIIDNALINETFTNFDRINQYYLDHYYNYNFDFTYNGDPTIEVGDMIQIETQFGLRNMRVKQNRFEFNGGLTCDVKGDGN